MVRLGTEGMAVVVWQHWAGYGPAVVDRRGWAVLARQGAVGPGMGGSARHGKANLMESWPLANGQVVSVVWANDKRSAELLFDNVRFDLIYAIIRADEELWFSLHEPARECGSADQAIAQAAARFLLQR